MDLPSPPRRGRPRQYLDDADRHRAFRERRQADLDRGDLARAVLRSPTPLLIERVAKQIVLSAPEPGLAAAALRHALESGISDAKAALEAVPEVSQRHRDE